MNRYDDQRTLEELEEAQRRFLPEHAHTIVARRIQRGTTNHSRTRIAKRGRQGVGGIHQRRKKHWNW